jgi:hypothetical protein
MGLTEHVEHMKEKNNIGFFIRISHGEIQFEGPRRTLEHKLLLKFILEMCLVRIWAAFNWFRIGPSDGLGGAEMNFRVP